MSKQLSVGPTQPGKRRRFTVEQKRALLLAAEAPGSSISEVARRYSISPSLLFQWRNAMENGKDKGLESGEDVVPASQLRQAEARIRELERILGKKTVQVEILEEAVRIAREKKLISPASLPKKGRGR
jgi:transposase